MAKINGWKKKYSYLDDYKKGMDGKYVYYGKHHVFQGNGQERRRYKWMLGGMDLLAAAIFIASGLMNGGALWYTWYSVLPYALEALLVFLLLWKTISLILEKHPVKSYIYRKTVPWFKPLGMLLFIIALVAAAGAGLCMILKPLEVHGTECVIYIILQVLLAVCSFLFARKMDLFVWEEEDAAEEVQ